MNKFFSYLLAILVFLLPLSNLFTQFLQGKVPASEYLFLYKDLLLVPILAYLIWQIGLENYQKLQAFGKPDLQTNLESDQKNGDTEIATKEISAPKKRISTFQKLFSFVRKLWQLCLFNWEIGLLLVLHIFILISAFANQTILATFFKAYYFEIWWLDFFVLVVTWLKYHKKNKLSELVKILKPALIVAYLLVLALSVAILVFGQSQVLVNFGYSTDFGVVEANQTSLISKSPVCHSVDAGIDKCRLMSSFAHPLHLASYLLVMLALLLVWALESKKWLPRFFYLLLAGLGVYLLYETFARYSWLTVFLLASLALIYSFYRGFKRSQFSLFVSKSLLVFCLFLSIFTAQIVFNTDVKQTLPDLPTVLVKTGSNDWHYRRIQAATEIINQDQSKIWFGYGLGAIGSSARSKYQDLSKNYIYQNYSQIGSKYFLKPEEMMLLDNWFLQVLINGGIYYFVIYLVLLSLPLWSLLRFLRQKKWDTQSLTGLIFVITFLGILIGSGLQLLFESQTLVIYWTILYLFMVKNQSLPNS